MPFVPPKLVSSLGTIAIGGGGNVGFSNRSISIVDWLYASDRAFMRCAASWRAESLAAIWASAFFAMAAASGSFLASSAASRFASAPLWMVRGMVVLAWVIAWDACVSHLAAPALYSPRRRVSFARFAVQVRNASLPSPFHCTI